MNGLTLAATLAVFAVAAIHVGILILEMFFWDAPVGRKAFRLTPEFARATRTLAANQGLYNGFLAAGLFWGLLLGEGGGAVRAFFLGCVLVAGVFGALTVSRKIFWIQAAPAGVALGLSFLAS
jgi:putative membrane protein